MLTDVEGKTYEFGMLRALGFNTNNLITLIFIQAFTFAVPGLLIGLTLAAALNSFCRFGIFNIFQIFSTYGLTYSSLVIGIVMGLVLPLLSNILPV